MIELRMEAQGSYLLLF